MNEMTGIEGVENLFWEAALNSSETAALVFHPQENRIYHYSDGMLKLTGWPGYKLIRRKVSDLFGSSPSSLVGFTLACMEHGSHWTDELSLQVGKDHIIPLEIFGSTFSIRGSEHILFLCFDRKEMKIRRSQNDIEQIFRHQDDGGRHLNAVFENLERGNRLILDAVGEGIYGVDASGATTFVNPAAERMLGWKAHELVGRIAHNVMHYAHEDGSPYPIKCCPIYAAFQDGAVHHVDHEVFWRKDGTPLHVDYTSTPIKEKGKNIGAVVVFRDITARRKTDIRLKNALHEVEQLKKKLELENAYLQDELSAEHNYKEIVGNSPAIQTIIGQIELVGPTDANVLISGESGTGKELIARAIHQSSNRRDRPLIRVNCAAIPRELFESEFFGHKKGSFTGALADRVGRFELADGGTIFLDEIGELPIEQQAKLLRVLQEGQFERLGDTKTREVNVRVIAATNIDLQQSVQKKMFREDLFFRLNVFPIVSAPLRDRKQDIPLLASHFVKKVCRKINKPMMSISLADVDRLSNYDWPGNIRELENFIERAVIISNSTKLKIEDPTLSQTPCGSAGNIINSAHILTESDKKKNEKNNIISALKSCNGRVSGKDGAAELLGTKPTTLYSRLKRYNIDARKFKS